MSRSRVCTGGVALLHRLGTGGIVLLAAMLLAAACTPTRPKLEPPTVTVESVRILRVADGMANLSLGLRLTNPNNFELAIAAIDFEVTLDGRQAASVRSVRMDPLPAAGEAKLELAGRVDVGAVATALMTLGAQLPVEYVLKGTATLRDGRALPFAHKGEIPVARFERALGARP
jgi:LEA14-like dessication related protein